MKAKVIIEHGTTSIILTPENEFEKDIIEKVEDRRSDFDLKSNFNVDREIYSSSTKINHNITIKLVEKIEEKPLEK